MTASPKLVCADLLTQEAGSWQLVGNRCANCGEVFFPAASGCTRCCGSSFEPFVIGSGGTLWSWTIQNFLPKAPYDSGETEVDFKPYGVGYIQMPCGIKIEARLTVADPQVLQIGMSMDLQLSAYRKAGAVDALHTFAFAPARGIA